MNLRYVSPVQRAQRATEAAQLINAINGVMQLAQLDPTALDTLDSDKIGRFLFEANGVSMDLLRTPQAVAELRKARADQQARQEQFQMLNEGAQTAMPLLTQLASQGANEQAG